jgi:hypothetical protein
MVPVRPAVVLFVADVPRLAGFYRALGGLSLLHEDAEHVVLAMEGMELVIHALRDESGSPRSVVTVREDAYWKLCLPVESIAGARAVAVGLGGLIGPVSGEWQARDFRACDGHDPEGNVLQVRERVV